MSFLIIKLHKENSYCVSPHVASNFFEPPLHTTCPIQLVGSCVTGIKHVTHGPTLYDHTCMTDFV